MQANSGEVNGRIRARARFITQSMQLEEHDVPGVTRGAMCAALGLAVFLFTWASFAPLNEVAISFGEVVSGGAAVEVEHPQSGFITEVSVREGQVVEIGELLAQLTPVQTDNALEQAELRRAGLMLQEMRLQAVLLGEPPDFGALGAEFPDLAQLEADIYEAQANSVQAQRQSLQNQIAKSEQQVATARKQSKELHAQIKSMREQVSSKEQQVEEGVITNTEFLAFKQRMADATVQRDDAYQTITRAQRALNESTSALSALADENQERLHQDVAAVTEEIAELDGLMRQMEQNVTSYPVRAKIAGTVTSLNGLAVGSMVDAGDAMMVLQPMDKSVLVKSRLVVEDASFVRAGQNAFVTLPGSDPQKFGQIAGVVEYISEYTHLDDEQQPYYLAEISLSSPFLGEDASRYRLKPGMTVQAHILTGEQTVLGCLLAPLLPG